MGGHRFRVGSSARIPARASGVSRKQGGAVYHAGGHQVVQWPAGVHHDDQLSRLGAVPVDLALRLLDLRYVKQDAMAEHLSKLSSANGKSSTAALPELLAGKLTQRQPGPDPFHGRRGQVNAR